MRRVSLVLCLAPVRAVAPTQRNPMRSSSPKPNSSNPLETKSFWCCKSKEVPLHEVKRTYAQNRFMDKKSRFSTRQHMREDGLASNLYLLRLHPGVELQSYEITATRRLLPGKSDHSPLPKGRVPREKGKETMTRRVDSVRAWRVVERYLQRHFPEAPAHVCVRNTLYAAGPLPATALTLPREAMDYGWDVCQLRWVGKVTVAQLPAEDLQELANKVVLWAVRKHGDVRGKGYAVVREATGKLVATEGGVSISGLRVFRGTIARVVFIDAVGAVDESGEAIKIAEAKAMEVPTSAVLTTLQAGVHAEPLRFLIREFVREFEYKGTTVQSYRIEDASGVIMASLWKATKEATLVAGTVYETRNFHVRIFASRGDMRLVEMVVGEAITTPIAKETVSSPDASLVSSKAQEEKMNEHVTEASETDTKRKGKKNASHETTPEEVGRRDEAEDKKNSCELALKIDTKCTVASEQSLWAEVKQHFGSGPYDTTVEENITRAVQGTPVVTAHTLHHGVVRLLRFNVAPDTLDLHPTLRQRMHDIEPGQPFALLKDGTLLPLQALHCSYDPRMRAWQDVTVTACSLLPTDRLAVLDTFRLVLESGLREWGLVLAARPCASRELALLPAPQRIPSGTTRSTPSPPHRGGTGVATRALPSFPSVVGIVAIAGAHADEAERSRMSQTAQSLGAAFRSSAVATVVDEQAAVAFVSERMASETNAVVVFISAERESRPARWASAECLVRGVLPIFLPPAASPKRQTLLAQNARMRIRNCFGTDPAQGVQVAREVPALSGRRVLVVGIDACHTTTFSTCAVVGMLCTPQGNHLLPVFWKHETRGQEVDQVATHFGVIVTRALELYDGIDEIVVFQDGDVYSEVDRMRTHVPVSCGFTFMCLHKRTNIRFVHIPNEANGNTVSSSPKANNSVKGAVVQALTPVTPNGEETVLSFYLQNHDCNMSTARTVQYTVHATSPSLDVADVQQLSHVLSHVMATQSTKLPMAARCAHRLASVAERLFDAAPPLTYDMIPAPLRERLWFM